MDKESYIFTKFANEINGDDGAVVSKWVFSKDLFCENVHFRRSWMSLRQIAIKSMLVNISDAVVMNARPKYALLGLSLPRNISESEIDELTGGFLQTAKKFGIKIIGGDTISGEKIDISVTIISKLNGPAVFRKNAQKGDLIAFTGELGDVKRDFEILEQGGEISPKSKFFEPKLKSKFFYKISPFINSAMDISDGLSKDLSRLLKLSNLGIKFSQNLSENEMQSGEEYEILFSFSPKNLEKIKKIAKKTGTKITIFGKLCKISDKTKFTHLGAEHHFN